MFTVIKLLRSIVKWKRENQPLGRALGYPECCIYAFCLDSPYVLKARGLSPFDKMRYEASFVDGKYTGFIPCPTCARKVLSGEITLASLIKNRSPEFPPFPEYANAEFENLLNPNP